MSGDDAALATSVHHGMNGNDLALLEDTHLVGGAVHLDGPAPSGVGHAVEIAADGDHAVLSNPALQPQHGLERAGRQRLQAGTLLGKVLADHAACCGMNTGIGDVVEPLAELLIEVVEVAEVASEEEVLADITEWAFDLASGQFPSASPTEPFWPPPFVLAR